MYSGDLQKWCTTALRKLTRNTNTWQDAFKTMHPWPSERLYNDLKVERHLRYSSVTEAPNTQWL